MYAHKDTRDTSADDASKPNRFELDATSVR